MSAPLAPYDFTGRRLAIVEHMLHHPYELGLRQARERGLFVRLLVGDRDWYTHGQPWETHPMSAVDEVVDVDTSDPDAVLAAVTDGEGRPDVDGVTSFSDYHTVVAATVARRLGLPGPDPQALETANVKDRLRVALGDVGFNIPHVLVTERAGLAAAAERLGFPMIAKPPAEAISYGVRRVDDLDQLGAAFDELSQVRHSLRGQPRPGHVLLEQYVEGVEVSVESMTVDGHTHIYGVTSKDLFGDPAYIECGHTFPVAMPQPRRAELYDVVRRTLDRIGYRHGPCHTEVRWTGSRWRIIEANPRTPSSCMTMLVTDVTGRSPILDAWLLALGQEPPVEPVTWTGGAAVRMVYPGVKGVLERVEGVAEAAAVPGVEVLLHVHPGEHLMARMDNSSCVGFTYCAADDVETAAAAVDEAAARLRFVTAGSDQGAMA